MSRNEQIRSAGDHPFEHSREHPKGSDLALLASDDLPIWRRMTVANHVQHCAHCDGEVRQFQAASMEIKRAGASETLTAFEAVGNWASLEREMIGNIKVGVAAAQCIEKTGVRRFHHWHACFIVAALSVLFIAGWLIHIPTSDTEHMLSAFRLAFTGSHTATSTILQTTPEGVAVRSRGAMLTVMHPASAQVTLSVTSSSSVGARYFDDETGQVTITSVYGQ
jgi:hypothetical protein